MKHPSTSRALRRAGRVNSEHQYDFAMKPANKFAPYRRDAFLSTVDDKHRALATRLCALLERSFDPADIQIYAGFPIVVRDMEWIAGFAMRANGPVAYCCSPATLAEMGAELKPYMSGKSCIAVKPRKGETIDDVLALVARAFATASRHGGMISKTDARKRDTARKKAAAGKKQAPSSKRTAPAKTTLKLGLKTGLKKRSSVGRKATRR
jgi:hypothetical protein